MSASAGQLQLFASPELRTGVKKWLLNLLNAPSQPSAAELLQDMELDVGIEARFVAVEEVGALLNSPELNRSQKQYLVDLLADDGLPAALRGSERPGKAIESSIDALLASTVHVRHLRDYQEMLSFMARFRDYSPYNNMLVRVQNPACSFFASKRDWEQRFRRRLKEDARPMMILAVMGPLMCVYDLDQTEGPELPERLRNFARFEGAWNPNWLNRLVSNAAGFGIKVDLARLSSTNAGYATARARLPWKMRVALHEELDFPSLFGVLCHELAHIFLGHLGQDDDGWWPSRTHLTHAAIEVEAESVAFLVTERFGLTGSSDAYVAALTQRGELPVGVSLDNVARVAGLVERMTRETVKPTRGRKAGART